VLSVQQAVNRYITVLVALLRLIMQPDYSCMTTAMTIDSKHRELESDELN